MIVIYGQRNPLLAFCFELKMHHDYGRVYAQRGKERARKGETRALVAGKANKMIRCHFQSAFDSFRCDQPNSA